MENGVDLFIDSGGYSAWSQNVKIDINDYIDFIKKHHDVINVYANLDIIGDGEGTWKNQKKMEKAGLNPIPVYHYGTDIKWLKKYIKKGYDYISLGGMVPVSTNALIFWLDYLFSELLTDERGFPRVKVHGFGLTSLKLMLRYPWYSVDSASWVVSGRRGAIYVPRYRNGKWIYDENSWKIAVSSSSPRTADRGKHLFTLPPKEKQLVIDYVHDKGYRIGRSEFMMVDADRKLKENERWAVRKNKGTQKRLLEVIKEEGISNRYQIRDEINIIYFRDLENSMPEYPWAFKKTRRKGFGL